MSKESKVNQALSIGDVVIIFGIGLVGIITKISGVSPCTVMIKNERGNITEVVVGQQYLKVYDKI